MRNKKGFIAGVAFVGILLIVFAVMRMEDNSGDSVKVIEIEAYDFPEPPSQIALIGTKPCVLVAGEAYLYEDTGWSKIYAEKELEEIYAGEVFCALTEDGEIFVTEDSLTEYEGYPSGSAGAYYNAEKMLQYCSDTSIEKISANILNDYIIAASGSGEIKVYVNGLERGVAEPIHVADMSGKYLLSEKGEVYLVSYPDSFERVRVKRVSDEKFVSISACPTANRCIGVKQDGSIEVWSDVDGELASDFRDIEKISMGFHYCIALSGDGEVCFSAYDEELEAEIRDYLKTLGGKAIDVTCAYNRITILFKDSSVCMVDILGSTT